MKLTGKGHWMAAVLSCGPGAVLSHRAAIGLWELRPPPSGRLDVTVSGRGRRPRTGIRVHNVRALHPDDVTQHDGIPVTSVHRTLLDYAGMAPRQQVRLAIEEADRRELFDLNRLEPLLHRSQGRRGVKAIRAILTDIRGAAPWPRSELERRGLAFVRGAGLPEPQVNVLVAGELVDLYWPGNPGLVVELDSWDFHKTRAQFEKDRRRDAKLQSLGYRVIRITQRRIETEPEELLRELAALMPAPVG